MKKNTKKVRTLIITVYASGVVGKGKSRIVKKRSVLTPAQYKERYYRSEEHARTEYAIRVQVAPKKEG